MKNNKKIASNRYAVIGFLILIAFSFSRAGAESVHGIFMVVKGDVSLTNNKQQKQKVKVGDKVFQGDIIESAKEARAKIVMSDRNVINISPETKLEIQKYENDGDKKNVEMNLLQGKVRNNVEQKYDGEKNKFLLKTPTAVAGVRGTQFLTSFDPSTRITSVVTLRGAVSVAPTTLTTGNIRPVVVRKGESTSMSAGANPEPPKALPKEEIKKIEQESTAAAAPAKSDVAKESRSPSMADGSPQTDASTNQPNTMVEANDMDAGQFKEIRMPTADMNQPLPPPPTLISPVLPPPPPQGLINDLIGGATGRARLILTPLPQ